MNRYRSRAGIKHSAASRDRVEFAACGTGSGNQNDSMNSALWIAVIASVFVVLAHVGLFWWFLVRKGKGDDGNRGDR